MKKRTRRRNSCRKTPNTCPCHGKGGESDKHFKPAFGCLSDGRKYGILRDAFMALKKAGLNCAGSLSTNPFTREVYNNRACAFHTAIASLTLTAMTENSSFRDSHISKDFRL